MAGSTIRNMLLNFSATGLRQTTSNMGRLNAEIDKGNKGVAGFGKNSTANFAKMSQGLGGMVHVYASVAANVYALSSAFTVLSDAADFSNMQSSAEALSTSTGIHFQSVAESMKLVSGGAIGIKEAMQTASIGLSAGFDPSQMEKLTEVAIKAANAMGRSVPEAIQRFTQAVVKNEPELVDEYGIILRVDEATRNYAESLGKTKAELTSTEKAQAIMNQALEQGIDKFGDAEVQVNAFSKLGATFSHLTQVVLQFFNEGITPVINYMSENKGVLGLMMFGFAKSILSTAIPALGEFGKVFSSQIDTQQAKLKKLQLSSYNSILEGLPKQEKGDILKNIFSTENFDDAYDQSNSFSNIINLSEGDATEQAQAAELFAKNMKDAENNVAGTSAYMIKLKKEIDKVADSGEELDLSLRKNADAIGLSVHEAEYLKRIYKSINDQNSGTNVDPGTLNTVSAALNSIKAKSAQIKLNLFQGFNTGFEEAEQGVLGFRATWDSVLSADSLSSGIGRAAGGISRIIGRLGGMIGTVASVMFGLFESSKLAAEWLGLLNKEGKKSIETFDGVAAAVTSYNKTLEVNIESQDSVIANINAQIGLQTAVIDQLKEMEVISKNTAWDRFFNIDFRQTSDYMKEIYNNMKAAASASSTADFSPALAELKSIIQEQERLDAITSTGLDNSIAALSKFWKSLSRGWDLINKGEGIISKVLTNLKEIASYNNIFVYLFSQENKSEKEILKLREDKLKQTERIKKLAEDTKKLQLEEKEHLMHVKNTQILISKALKTQAEVMTKAIKDTPYGDLYEGAKSGIKDLEDYEAKVAKIRATGKGKMHKVHIADYKNLSAQMVEMGKAIDSTVTNAVHARIALKDFIVLVEQTTIKEAELSNGILQKKMAIIDLQTSADKGNISAMQAMGKIKASILEDEKKILKASIAILETNADALTSLALIKDTLKNRLAALNASKAVLEAKKKLVDISYKEYQTEKNTTEQIQSRARELSDLAVSELTNAAKVKSIKAEILKTQADGGTLAQLELANTAAITAEQAELLALDKEISEAKKNQHHLANNNKDTIGEIAVLEAERVQKNQEIKDLITEAANEAARLQANLNGIQIDTDAAKIAESLAKAQMQKTVIGHMGGNSVAAFDNVAILETQQYMKEVASIENDISLLKIETAKKGEQHGKKLKDLAEKRAELAELELDRSDKLLEDAKERFQLQKDSVSLGTVLDKPGEFGQILKENFANISRDFADSVMNPVDRAADAILRTTDSAVDALFSAIAAGEDVADAISQAVLDTVTDIATEYMTETLDGFIRQALTAGERTTEISLLTKIAANTTKTPEVINNSAEQAATAAAKAEQEALKAAAAQIDADVMLANDAKSDNKNWFTLLINAIQALGVSAVSGVKDTVSGIGGFLGSIFGGSTTSATGIADQTGYTGGVNGVLSGNEFATFAKGGIVSAPTTFANGAGLMGEAGPEAIMPLTRSNGVLGVQAAGGGTTINVHNYGNSDVTTEESQDSKGGKTLDIIIQEKVNNAIQGGGLDKQMSTTYGIKRRGY